MFGRLAHRRLICAAALATGWWSVHSSSLQAANATGGVSDSSPFVVQTWQVEDGLPHNSVNAILQTRDGYLWLATDDGLARFDGVNFTVFGLAQGLPSLQALTLLEDRAGALWIGTGQGLSRLQNGRFQTWTTKDGLAGNEITTLAEDVDGSIWIGTVTGLNLWQNGEFRAFGKAEGLNDKRVRVLAANPQGGVWVSMFYEGLFQWDRNRFMPIGPAQGLPQAPPVTSLLEDRRGNLWAGTAGGTVLCRQDGLWRQYGREHGLPANTVMRLVEGADGTIWAAMSVGGLCSLAKSNAPAVWQRADFPDRVVSVLEDREQNLWVGTRASGLARLTRKRVSVFPILDGANEASPRTLAETADGVLWVGSGSRGVFRIQNGKLDSFLRTPVVRRYPFVGAVLATRDGGLWWGSGTALFHWRDEKLQPAYTSEQNSWLREDRIRVLCEDNEDGLWVGTQNGQLRLLRAGQFLALTNWQSTAPLTALLQQTDGTLLVGTYGNGLIRVRDGKSSSLTNPDAHAIRFVRALYQDATGILWIGTEGTGLTRLEAGQLTTVTTRNGLINDTIVQILEDDAGYLWLGSYRGILRVSKLELNEFAAGKTAFVHPLILNQSDGLPSEQCMRGFNAGLKTRAGLLHFSTGRGIVVINPQQQRTNASPPAVWLEKLLVDGKVYHARIQAGDETAATTRTEPLQIPPGKRRLEFHYTGLRLSAPEHVRFRYQLEGFDDQWIEAGRDRVAFYSLLPAGHYRFRVTASDDSGIWNKPGVMLGFTIKPYFWQTWWFRLGLIAVLIASVVAVVRYVSYRRLRQRLHLLEQEAAVQQDRARIAKDLHDDLGAHLSQIAMLSELAQTDFDKPVQARGHLDQIFHTAHSVTRSLDEIVWAVNPRNDSLDRFTAHICTFAPEFLRVAGISCRLDVPMDVPPTPLTANVCHHLYLAFKEALHNVVKHAGATEVWLRLKVSPREFTLVIEDNGRGFQQGVGATPGEDGLLNLRQRMSEIGGSFELQSEPGRGTRTVLMAPLKPESP